MKFIDKTCSDFIDALSSKEAVPGGGGASALLGALSAALGMMVCNLTVGKQKYADVQDDILQVLNKAEALKSELLHLVDEDAACFKPLAQAYGIPKDDHRRGQILEDALKLACTVPMDIMRLCADAVLLHEELLEKGSRLALSDVGVGVIFCKAALQGAALNVFINTKTMKSREYASLLDAEANGLLDKHCALADKIYEEVTAKLK